MADIEAIRKRQHEYRDAYARVLRAGEPDSDRADDYPAARENLFKAAVDVASDVEGLINEIEGLRATLNLRDGQLTAARRHADERGAALLEEQTVHAKTMDNFEAQAESWLEERTRLLDRYARLDVAAEHLRTSRNGLMRELAEARVTIRSLVGEPDGGTG